MIMETQRDSVTSFPLSGPRDSSGQTPVADAVESAPSYLDVHVMVSVRVKRTQLSEKEWQQAIEGILRRAMGPRECFVDVTATSTPSA